MLLQIDNNYADVTIKRARRPWEITAPLQALGTGRTTREAQARQTAALLFSRSFAAGRDAYVGTSKTPVERYAHLYPRAHPGATAPLGWTLSSSSRADLAGQLRRQENLEELKTIRDWFDPRLSCR